MHDESAASAELRHELNNLMQIAYASVELARADLSADNAPVTARLDKALGALDHAIEIIGTLSLPKPGET